MFYHISYRASLVYGIFTTNFIYPCEDRVNWIGEMEEHDYKNFKNSRRFSILNSLKPGLSLKLYYFVYHRAKVNTSESRPIERFLGSKRGPL